MISVVTNEKNLDLRQCWQKLFKDLSSSQQDKLKVKQGSSLKMVIEQAPTPPTLTQKVKKQLFNDLFVNKSILHICKNTQKHSNVHEKAKIIKSNLMKQKPIPQKYSYFELNTNAQV